MNIVQAAAAVKKRDTRLFVRFVSTAPKDQRCQICQRGRVGKGKHFVAVLARGHTYESALARLDGKMKAQMDLSLGPCQFCGEVIKEHTPQEAAACIRDAKPLGVSNG